MKTEDIKMIISGIINLYLTGLYTVSDCLKRIEKTIQEKTAYTLDINSRIEQQNQLYKYAMFHMHKAIIRLERRQ